MGDWSDNLPYECREYAGHLYETDDAELHQLSKCMGCVYWEGECMCGSQYCDYEEK